MRFQSSRVLDVAATLLFLLLAAPRTTLASHVVSGSTSRLPMSLSTVITDLEAEGATRVTTAAFLTSRSVTKSSRSKLLRTLFGITGDGDHDDEVQDGTTTAFGKKMTEESEEESDSEGENVGIGVVVGNPLPGSSATEVATTVVACGGTIVFVLSTLDLDRGEGLFDSLAPAIERLLAQRAADDAAAAEEAQQQQQQQQQQQSAGGDGTSPPAGVSVARASALLVVVDGARNSDDLIRAKSKFEGAASSMLANIVQPADRPTSSVSLGGTRKKRATVLSDVFERIEYVPSVGPVDDMLCDMGGAVDPGRAAKSVASIAMAGMLEMPLAKATVSGARTKLTSPVDLAVARRLGPASRAALAKAVSTVTDVTGGSGALMGAGADNTGDVQLVSNCGQLCDAAVKQAMDLFDAEVGKSKTFKSSKIAKHIRSDLLEEIYAELAELYELQLQELRQACFESFRRGLSRLRVSPNLPSDMDRVVSESMKDFITAAKKLRATGTSSWPSDDVAKVEFRKSLREYCTDRLQLARASGQYRPAPRKGVTVGFHWLFPKPFGNDYRQEPWDLHAKDDLVYVPPDKITDVSPDDVRTGDWRRSVVPNPTGNEMIYMQ